MLLCCRGKSGLVWEICIFKCDTFGKMVPQWHDRGNSVCILLFACRDNNFYLHTTTRTKNTTHRIWDEEFLFGGGAGKYSQFLDVTEKD